MFYLCYVLFCFVKANVIEISPFVSYAGECLEFASGKTIKLPFYLKESKL